VKLRRGIKAWSEGLARHLEVVGRVARGRRKRQEEVATVGRWGRKMNLIAQAHLIERREGGGQLGRREPKGKTYFCNYANGARGPNGLGRPMGFGLRERRGQREPAGPKVEWAARSVGPKVKKRNF
jgi:hypothetical protein